MSDVKAQGGGFVDADTLAVLPWLLCFFVFLALAWLGWFLRHRISQCCCRPPPEILALPPSTSPSPPSQKASDEVIQWQWISTGKPPTPVRGRSKSYVGFRSRHYSLRSEKSWKMVGDDDSVRFSIGGDMTPSSSKFSISIPVQSPSGQRHLSQNEFKVLLGRVCSITDPEIKKEVFELTFDIIQLGSWADDQWFIFTMKLFTRHPAGPNHVSQLQQYYRNEGMRFTELVRTILNDWLAWQGVEKADMKDIYEALESCDKLDTAHNAAVNVVLALRRAQGRITSECVDPFSDWEESQTWPPALDYEVDAADDGDADLSVSVVDPLVRSKNRTTSVGSCSDKENEQMLRAAEVCPRFRRYSVNSSLGCEVTGNGSDVNNGR